MIMDYDYEYYFTPEAIAAYGLAAPIIRLKGYENRWAYMAYKVIHLKTGTVIKNVRPDLIEKKQRYRSIDDPLWEVGE